MQVPTPFGRQQPRKRRGAIIHTNLLMLVGGWLYVRLHACVYAYLLEPLSSLQSVRIFVRPDFQPQANRRGGFELTPGKLLTRSFWSIGDIKCRVSWEPLRLIDGKRQSTE